jgi:hypothetical protein
VKVKIFSKTDIVLKTLLIAKTLAANALKKKHFQFNESLEFGFRNKWD